MMTAITPHWEHFEHMADIGVRGVGNTPAEAFEQAALALTAIVTDPTRVAPRERVPIHCPPAELDVLLVDWLNAVIYEMDTRDLLFGAYRVRLGADGLTGEARGEPVDPARHRPAVDVTGLHADDIRARQAELADLLAYRIPAGVGSKGAIRLDDAEMDAMLRGGAAWAVARGWGVAEDLTRIEERGRMEGADPGQVSDRAKERQRREMGTLGSGNHYLEVQRVAAVYDEDTAEAYGLRVDEVKVAIHCGSRGLGHQIGTEYLRRMVTAAGQYGITLPDRELACAPIDSPLGQAYLGAMRAAINCALANRQIITHLARQAFAQLFPDIDMPLLYDVSHNTCKEEWHEVDGERRRLFVHRKGPRAPGRRATRTCRRLCAPGASRSSSAAPWAPPPGCWPAASGAWRWPGARPATAPGGP